MKINEFELPSSFVEIISKNKLPQKIGSWNLLRNIDAYGNFLESELSEIYKTEIAIRQETNLLQKHFVLDGYYGEPSEWQNSPGYIDDIIDFSKIICFGMSGDGAPFCFDYRDNSKQPSVIWWNDVFWRRIAPNFDSFIALFNL